MQDLFLGWFRNSGSNINMDITSIGWVPRVARMCLSWNLGSLWPQYQQFGCIHAHKDENGKCFFFIKLSCPKYKHVTMKILQKIAWNLEKIFPIFFLYFENILQNWTKILNVRFKHTSNVFFFYNSWNRWEW